MDYGQLQKLRAVIEQLVGEAASGELSSQRQLEDLRKHRVMEVVRDAEAAAEAALKASKKPENARTT